MLVALGALEPTDHWQLPHLPGIRLAELAKELSLQLCKQGDIPWTKDHGKSLLLEIKNATRYSTLGWVEQDELEALVDLLACGKLDGMKYVFGDDEQEPADCMLETMLGEKKENDKHDRFAGLIDELMNDGYSGE
jgi:hypothetical protein